MPDLDLLVLGSGVAGLSAAVRAATMGLRVGVLTKGELEQSATRWAQGGVAAELGDDEDSTDLHLADTLAAGAGLWSPGLPWASASRCGPRIPCSPPAAPARCSPSRPTRSRPQATGSRWRCELVCPWPTSSSCSSTRRRCITQPCRGRC